MVWRDRAARPNANRTLSLFRLDRARPSGQGERTAVVETARGHSTACNAWLSVPTAMTGLALLAAALRIGTPFNHDEAHLIEAAGRLLDGGRFGKDVADMNPPQLFWISAIPVWLARQIGARCDIIATLFTSMIAAVSLIASDRLIASGRSADPVTRPLLLVAAIILLFAPGYDFGQR
jgi:hypothetical protein